MNILVTGGTGFIGSHACCLLIEKGYCLFIIDSLINSKKDVIEMIKNVCDLKNISTKNKLYFFKGDLRNINFIEKVFQEANGLRKNINAVIHFAGLKDIRASYFNAIDYWDSNVNSTINLLKVMTEYNCQTIVFSSSASIYEYGDGYSIKEKNNINPSSPYGKTKNTIEQILKDIFCTNKGVWRVANLRYFNPIGAHSSGLIGEFPKNMSNNLFPILSNVAIGKIKNLEIYGNDWPTRDGTAIRDYIHVVDLVEGHLLALENLLQAKSKFLELNLGTGKGTTVLELIKIFEKISNVNIPYIFLSRRKGDRAIIVADNSLAKSTLGWSPKRTIEEMCIDGWNWQKSQIC